MVHKTACCSVTTSRLKAPRNHFCTCLKWKQALSIRLPEDNQNVGRLLNIVTSLHKRTKRDYLPRMVDDKVHCMLKAKEYEFDYWDGDRRYGYGGCKFIERRWKPVAQAPIDIYGLTGSAKDLDVGCGTDLLLYEMKKMRTFLYVAG